MTPPKVEGALKPTSSVMIKRMFGAPFGGTTRAGQAAFDCRAFRLISPWNGADGGGRSRPSIVVVASGEPGVPVVCCWAKAPTAVVLNSPATNDATAPIRNLGLIFMV